jgi:outer membrane lipopolysaccharide assembly protein LptE/RlpB
MKKVIFLFAFLVFAAAGCASLQEQDYDAKIVKLYIKPSSNLTNQFGIDMEFMIAFTNNLLRDGRLTFVNSQDQADATVILSIKRYVNEPLTYDKAMNIEQSKLAATVTFSVIDYPNKKVLFNALSVSAISIYRNPSDIANSIDTETKARNLLWDKISRTIIKDILKVYADTDEQKDEGQQKLYKELYEGDL